MTIRGLLFALPVVAVGWIAIMALVMRFSDAAPAAVVFWPTAEFMAQLPVGTSLLAGNSFTVTLVSDYPGFGAALYAAGARLVLPAGLTGCLPLPKQTRLEP